MSNFDDADDVFSALRLPASDAELQNESKIVELMANVHPLSKGNLMTSTSTRFTSRRARVGALIAAGVIGFGGIAAASPGGFDPLGFGLDEAPVVTEETVPDTTEVEETIPEDTLPEDTIPADTVVEDTDPETVVEEPPLEATTSSEPADGDETIGAEPAAAPLFVDNPDTAFDETTCLPGNHGKTVSAVARGEAPFEDVDVRDAAQSDCGKKGPEVVDKDEVDEVDDVDEVEQSDATESDAQASTKTNNGTTKSNGSADNRGKPEAPGNSGGKGKNGK